MAIRAGLFAPLCLAAIACACATVPPPVAEPAQRFSTSFPGAATLTIARASDHVCREAFVRAFVDGEFAGQFGPGATLALYLPAGAHVVAVAPNARCLEETASLPLLLDTAAPTALVTDFDFIGHIRLQAQAN